MATSTVRLADLKLLVTEQDIHFKPGDILFIRFGFTAAYNTLDLSEQRALAERPTADFLGIESTQEVLAWLWENQFAAVASDSPSFESSPVGGRDKSMPLPFTLHPWLLAGWGMPIGEMFDLEELAQHCESVGRYDFFLSSVPLKVSRFPLAIMLALHVATMTCSLCVLPYIDKV